MSALKPRDPDLVTEEELDLRQAAIDKTLRRVNHAASHPEWHPPFHTLGLALQQAAAENA